MGGWEKGGVMTKRLRCGSGHRRLEACLPFNGRHKLASGRPDFFVLLRSPPSAIDALDTLFEPNAVFRQFTGSASIMLFLFSIPYYVFLSFPIISVLFFFPVLFRFLYILFLLFSV